MRPPVTASEIPDPASLKWSWACRFLAGAFDESAPLRVLSETSPPRPGDVALFSVERMGLHCHLETAHERRLRIYKGDRLVCVFGNRYATDVYEGRAVGLAPLHLLSGSGVVGEVAARHRSMGRPTGLAFLGYLAGDADRRVNLVDLRFRAAAGPTPACGPPLDVVAVIGTGMSTGKTTVTRKILRALVSRGIAAAGCKLTGTVSPRDLQEMRAAGARFAADFSEFGLPSTYGLSLDDLLRVFDGLLRACHRADSSLVVMEIADGLLQRETAMLVASEDFRRRIRGVVAVGSCSASALYAAERLQAAGFDVWAASGLFTNAPLFVREFEAHSRVPVVSSRSDADWAKLFLARAAARRPEERRREAAKADV